jgi:hypothetical protein
MERTRERQVGEKAQQEATKLTWRAKATVEKVFKER